MHWVLTDALHLDQYLLERTPGQCRHKKRRSLRKHSRISDNDRVLDKQRCLATAEEKPTLKKTTIAI